MLSGDQFAMGDISMASGTSLILPLNKYEAPLLVCCGNQRIRRKQRSARLNPCFGLEGYSEKYPRQPLYRALFDVDRHALAIDLLVHVIPSMAHDILFRLLVDLRVALETVDDVMPK